MYGAASVAVPGFVGGVGILWERWGRLPWADIVAPARELLEGGLSYDLVAEAVAKKRLGHRGPTDVAGADKENLDVGTISGVFERSS